MKEKKQKNLEQKIIDDINKWTGTGLISLKDRTTYFNYTALMRFFDYSDRVKLESNELDYLIKNSDLNQATMDGTTALMIAIINHKEVKLVDHQWNYLINNSKLELKDSEGWDALACAVYFGNDNVALKIAKKMIQKKNDDLNKDDYYNTKFSKVASRREELINKIRNIVEIARTTVIIDKEVINNKKKKKNKI